MQAARFEATESGALTPGMRAAFERDGFLILDRFVTADEIARVNQRIDALIAGAEAPENPTVFGDHAGDRYFLDSGDKVRFFFEPDAVGPDGRPNRAFETALNKIGHNLHDRDPVFDALFRAPRFRALADSLGQADAVLLQSMVIFKQPAIGAPVNWHQDATFLRTEPHSVLGLWLALEDADRENGCLYAVPGGHRTPLRKWFGRTASGDGPLEMRTLDDTPYETDGAVPLEAPAGTLVLLHGFLPHMSTANRSGRSRRAVTLHAVDGRLPYPADNWLQRPADDPPRRFSGTALREAAE